MSSSDIHNDENVTLSTKLSSWKDLFDALRHTLVLGAQKDSS